MLLIVYAEYEKHKGGAEGMEGKEEKIYGARPCLAVLVPDSVQR